MTRGTMKLNELVFYAAVCSDVGSLRKNNEDNFNLFGSSLHNNDYYGRYSPERSIVVDKGVVAVFDGMGGELYGEIASMIASKYIDIYRDALVSLSGDAFLEYFRAANDAICKKISEGKARMGSTAALVAINNGYCTIGNIGDSRIYLLSSGKLTQLSEDHTMAAQMVRANLMRAEDAKMNRRRHYLTQHLGMFSDETVIQPHLREKIALHPGDRLLLCSDGVTDALSDSDLLTLLSQETSCEKMVGGIVDSAINGGASDNVTALVIKVGYRSNTDGRPDSPYNYSDMETTITITPPNRGMHRTRIIAPVKQRMDFKSRSDLFFYVVWSLCGLLSFFLGGIIALWIS